VPGSAVDLWLRGNAVLFSSMNDLEKLNAARKYYDEALRIDPDNVQALLSLALLLTNLLQEDLDSDSATRAQRIEELDKSTTHAVNVDATDPKVWFQRSVALGWRGRNEQALAANKKAQSLDDSPNSLLMDQEAEILVALDRPEEALELVQRAPSATPRKSSGNEGYSIRVFCTINLMLGRYKEAAAFCEKSAARDNWWFDQMCLTAIYAQLGDSEKAAAAKAALLKQKPRFTVAKFRALDVNTNTGYVRRMETYFYAGLRKAGIPDE